MWAAVQLNVGKPGEAKVHDFPSSRIHLTGSQRPHTSGLCMRAHWGMGPLFPCLIINWEPRAGGKRDRQSQSAFRIPLQELSRNQVEPIPAEITGTRDKHVGGTRDVWELLSWIWSLFWTFHYVQRMGECAKVEEGVVTLNPRPQIVQDPRRLIWFMKSQG